jgi:2-polyprenyl-6-hydroxyphenyl methylase/3-demethylubiquinone-9 3-methyltransferase
VKSQAELKDLHGEEYVNNFADSTYRLDRLLPYIRLPKNADIVDYGCGTGLMMQLLHSKVRTYTGVDFSPPFIAAANQKKQSLGIRNAEFHCLDIHDFAKSNPARFDTAFAMDFSEHVYDEDWLKILFSIKRTLKPGGALYLHTPNKDFLAEICRKHNFILKQFPAHIAVRSIEENEALVRRAGYKVKTRTMPHYNILRLAHPFSYLPIIGKYFEARIFIEAINS